jgi:hypothetical protein
VVEHQADRFTLLDRQRLDGLVQPPPQLQTLRSRLLVGGRGEDVGAARARLPGSTLVR